MSEGSAMKKVRAGVGRIDLHDDGNPSEEEAMIESRITKMDCL